MAKIKPVLFTSIANILFVIDDQGNVWESTSNGSQWIKRGSLPEAK